MRHWSIATKIVLSTCLLMGGLLWLYAVALLQAQQQREHAFVAEYGDKLHRSIDERESAERASLHERVRFDSDILSRMGAGFLYNIDAEGLRRAMLPYLDNPAILAIQATDEEARPFVAVWRDAGEGQSAESLPENLALNPDEAITADARMDDMKVGGFQVYFSEAPLVAKIAAVKQRAQANLAAFQQDAEARLRQARLTLIGGTLILLLLLILAQLIALRLLVFNRLHQVSVLARRLAGLDLSVQVQDRRRDEVGRMFAALGEMIAAFEQIITEVRQTGLQVAASVDELSAAGRQQQAVMSTQMETLQQLVTKVESIATATHGLSGTVQDITRTTEDAESFAVHSLADLTRLEQSTARMQEVSQAVFARLDGLNAKAGAIGDIILAITKVADQTNFLSLNASIEAEKAGKAGRGFSVVAREIRRLADETAVATLDIEDTVKDMVIAVRQGSREIEAFIREIRHGSEDVTNVSAQLQHIIEGVRGLAPRFSEVNREMLSHADNAQDINQALHDLNEEIHETLFSVQESFNAIAQMNEATRHLQQEVSRFILP